MQVVDSLKTDTSVVDFFLERQLKVEISYAIFWFLLKSPVRTGSYKYDQMPRRSPS
jgi:hypothetical protein